jgi:hypothetical protein
MRILPHSLGGINILNESSEFEVVVSPLHSGLLDAITHEAISIYQTMVKELTEQGISGAADKAAKAPNFNARILSLLKAKVPDVSGF